MDIDKLFKVPKLPSGSNKRRMPDAPTPDMIKKMRVGEEDTGTRHSDPSPQPPKATVEDVDEDERMEDDEFAPGNDADYFAEEDEEGRFFGGGLTSEQKDILNIFDKAGGEGVQADVEEMNITGIRKLLLRLERAANKNQDQRSKYPDDPTKFIDSEADLDDALRALMPLAQAPILAYPELVRSGSVARLVGLLSHENADIAIDVIDLLHELTDEDNESEEDEDEEQRSAAVKALIEALLENSFLELLVENLNRLNEEEEADRLGVFHVLGILENVLAFNPAISKVLIKKTKTLFWTLNRIQKPAQDDNRGYAAELLSILIQSDRENRLAYGKEDGVEVSLRVLSQFRRRDPAEGEETEFMENVFDALCSALAEPENKKLFLDSEGVDLMVLMTKEKKLARSRAIKALDYAMSGPSGSTACETFVDALGLKSLFSTFMGKVSKKSKGSDPSAAASEETSHTLSVVSSLFTNLPSESPSRIRLLAKFVENNYEKVDKLLEIRESAQRRLEDTEADIERERKEILAEGEGPGEGEEALWYLRRLDGGLFTLQTVDYILAWLTMEDDGILSHIQQMLNRKNKSFHDLVKTLQIYHDNVDEPEPTDESTLSQKDILQNLMAFLSGS
ncbi:Catenin-beta-like protein [Thelephora terrestris]|uniref:Catenin-beta-like protein n=1 Tax=Thelephora terrestris TaxID=56493 RepID=A0A9P6H5X6_9AGAM|nr:Catenin-beta-like protein [Thelephora terrestris]